MLYCLLDRGSLHMHNCCYGEVKRHSLKLKANDKAGHIPSILLISLHRASGYWNNFMCFVGVGMTE